MTYLVRVMTYRLRKSQKEELKKTGKITGKAELRNFDNHPVTANSKKEARKIARTKWKHPKYRIGNIWPKEEVA